MGGLWKNPSYDGNGSALTPNLQHTPLHRIFSFTLLIIYIGRSRSGTLIGNTKYLVDHFEAQKMCCELFAVSLDPCWGLGMFSGRTLRGLVLPLCWCYAPTDPHSRFCALTLLYTLAVITSLQFSIVMTISDIQTPLIVISGLLYHYSSQQVRYVCASPMSCVFGFL